MKKLIIRLVLLGVVAAAIWGGYRLFQSMPHRQAQIASTRVRKGDVVVRSYARGELRAVRSYTMIAPNLFGTVQVTRLADLGSFAHEKDLIIEFDDSEVISRVEEKQLEIDQVDEQMKKAKADLAIRNNQDQVELLRARYAVRRSTLEVQRNELLPEIDQKKNLLNLEESKRRLGQLESDIKSRLEQAQAEMAVLETRMSKSKMEMARERQRLLQVKLLAPMSGLVAIRQNRQSGFFFPGMQIPDVREGDQVQPGMAVADVLDLSDLEVVAKIGELDRANLREGQEVLMTLDAVPEKRFTGRIKAMSGTASANIFSGDPAKKFDVVFSIDMKELLSGLGAKPDQIRRVMETAERNRRKPVAQSAPVAAGGPGTMVAMPGGGGGPGGGGAGPGGGMQAAMGAPAGGQAGGGQQGGGPGGGGRGMVMFGGPGGPGGQGGGSGMSEEDRTKMRAAMQKALNGRNMQELSSEERQKVFEEVRKAVPALANARRSEGQGVGGQGGGSQSGGGRRGGGGSEAVPASPGGGMPVGAPGGGRGQFSEKEMEAAKLPAPVEGSSQLDVLLRPGLLADVEIILEKIPDAINIPAQAVFEKDGKHLVYVRTSDKWEERVIKPLKRSESTVVVAQGLRVNEVIAMADPTAKPGAKKEKGGGAGAMSGMPGGRGGQ